MNGGWGRREMGSIHGREAGAERAMDAQAELLGPRTQGEAEGTARDVPLGLPAEGKLAARALEGGHCNNGNCYWALPHVLC